MICFGTKTISRASASFSARPETEWLRSIHCGTFQNRRRLRISAAAALPEKLKGTLPTIEELENELSEEQDKEGRKIP
jgi:hypothetical protein